MTIINKPDSARCCLKLINNTGTRGNGRGMNEPPEGWCETTVGAVSLDISYGYTTSASSKPNGPRFLRITDIQNGNVDWKSVPFCKVAPPDASAYLLKPGDLVFAR